MARAAAEEPREFYDPNDPNSQIREYIQLTNTLDGLEKRKAELRTKLFELLDNEGEEDHTGNIIYAFSQPIDGALRLEKQARRSRKLDELKAEEIIETAGLGDTVYKMVRVIDEDALMAAHYEGKLTEDQIDEMFPVNIVWALRVPKK